MKTITLNEEDVQQLKKALETDVQYGFVSKNFLECRIKALEILQKSENISSYNTDLTYEDIDSVVDDYITHDGVEDWVNYAFAIMNKYKEKNKITSPHCASLLYNRDTGRMLEINEEEL